MTTTSNTGFPLTPKGVIRFSSLAIGATFCTHYSHGAGAQKGVISWEVLRKKTKSKAEVIEAHGLYRKTGGVQCIAPHARIFLA
jgi:hypothetical protein